MQKLINSVKSKCGVIGLTASALGAARNRDNIKRFGIVVVGEAGVMNVPEFMSITANMEDS